MAKIFISGPYTHPNPEDNVRIAIEYAEMLLRLGHTPFVPHLCHYWDAVHRHDYETWMRYAMEWVQVCDCLFRLNGDSAGADREVALAEMLGKRVFTNFNELTDYLGVDIVNLMSVLDLEETKHYD
jgi:hypothetical protein